MMEASWWHRACSAALSQRPLLLEDDRVQPGQTISSPLSVFAAFMLLGFAATSEAQGYRGHGGGAVVVVGGGYYRALLRFGSCTADPWYGAQYPYPPVPVRLRIPSHRPRLLV